MVRNEGGRVERRVEGKGPRVTDSKGKRTMAQGVRRRQSIVLTHIPESLPKPDVATIIPLEMAMELRAVPLAIEEGVLTVAIGSLDDHESIDTLTRTAGCDVFVVLSPPDELEGALSRLSDLCCGG